MGSRVHEEGAAHIRIGAPSCGYLAYRVHHVVRNPLDEAGILLVLEFGDRPLRFNGADLTATEQAGGSKNLALCLYVANIAQDASRIEHLLGHLLNTKLFKLCLIRIEEWGLALHQEVQAWEWDQVGGQLPYVAVVLESREAQRGCGVRHYLSDDVVDVAEGVVLHLELLLANSIQSTILNRKGGMRVLNQSIQSED